MIVYVPASLRDTLREAAAVRSATYTELVLEAIDATHGRLAALLAPVSAKTRSGSLFTVPPARRRQRHTEPQVQVSIRPTRGDLDVIDRLTRETAAPSRSALVAAALTAHLR